MIIGVDAGCLGIKDERLKVGVYRMAVALLSSLGKIDKKNIYNLYSFYPIEKNILNQFGNNFRNVVIKPSKGWFNIWLPLAIRKNPVNIFLGISQSLPKLPKETKGVVFIHDLTFEKYPFWFENSYKKMSYNTRNAVKNADCIIAVSQATKRDIVNIYKVIPAKITVIYEGFNNRFKKISSEISNKHLKRLGITKSYFLFVGTFKPSKNIPNIIRAFNIFSKQKPDYQYQLVLVGSNLWLDQEIDWEIKKSQFKDKIKVLGFVNDTDLQGLYKKASLFVSPSFCEGFGLTHLEAALFKIPVITSKVGAIEEFLGENAFYVDPFYPQSIASSMIEAVTDRELTRYNTKMAYKIAKKFTWDESARKILSILKLYEKQAHLSQI